MWYVILNNNNYNNNLNNNTIISFIYNDNNNTLCSVESWKGLYFAACQAGLAVLALPPCFPRKSLPTVVMSWNFGKQSGLARALSSIV